MQEVGPGFSDNSSVIEHSRIIARHLPEPVALAVMKGSHPQDTEVMPRLFSRPSCRHCW
jgi:hypothetical protein